MIFWKIFKSNFLVVVVFKKNDLSFEIINNYEELLKI